MIVWQLLLLSTCEEGPYFNNDIIGEYNDWIFARGAACTGGKIVDNYYCVCDGNKYYENGTCVDTCTEGTEPYNNICLSLESLNDLEMLFPATGSLHFRDILLNVSEPKIENIVSMTPEIQEQMKNAAIKCKSTNDHKSCNFLSNMCVASMYDKTSSPCYYFNQIFVTSVSGQWSNYDWPKKKPFLTYTDTFRHIIDGSMIGNKWNLGDSVNIDLAVFDRFGQFKGFKKLDLDLQKCRKRSEIPNLWKKFGYNYHSQCRFSLTEELDRGDTHFYDAFLEDGDPKNPVLRPIPILLRNFHDDSVAVNRGETEDDFQLFRRFFLYDDYTTDSYIQYVTNVSLIFELDDDHHMLKVPYFDMEYVQVPKSRIGKDESLSYPQYEFNVSYICNMDNFWSAVLYIFIVLVMLGLTYWAVRTFVYFKTHEYGGTDCAMIVRVVAEFFECVATILIIMLMIFSMYFLWVYKWGKSLSLVVPMESELEIFTVILWIAIAMKVIAVVCKVLLQTNGDFFIIDWEEPPEKTMPISAWRRIMVANEWSKVSSVRACSVGFTLLVTVFLLDGLELKHMGSAIPGVDLIDVGKNYAILRFGFTVFVWMLLFLVQWAFIRFVYWNMRGDPHQNFMNICRAANISVMILSTRNHGFYIHGKNTRDAPSSLNDIADDEEESAMLDSYDSEGGDEHAMNPPPVGLSPAEPDLQVQELYLATECFHYIQDLYHSMRLAIQRRRENGDSDPAPYATYDTTNAFLKQFFSQRESKHKYVFQPYSYLQIFDIGPVIEGDSIFTSAPSFMVKDTMLYGIQGTLMIFYMLLFSGIDCATGQPCIASFVVFLLDVLVKLVFKYRSRDNLSNKALIDSRFILT